MFIHSVIMFALNPQERHDYILKTFVLNKSSENSRNIHKRDIDVIKENHKFLWEDDDVPESWESRLAKKYYDKLFKEYCIADLSRYKENKVALRWRTEQEVVTGKGQFQCGSRKCSIQDGLRSWEVNFSYLENAEKKNALIKLRLCPDCSKLLNYTSKKREIKRQKHQEKAQKISSKRRKVLDRENDTEETDEKVSKSTTSNKSSETTNDDESSNKTQNIDAPYTNDEIPDQSDIWSKKQEAEAEKVQREEEFEKYLEDLLL